MLIIGSKEQVQAYRESPAINQSTLKNLQYGLANFLKKQDEEGPVESFNKGSAVDCILTAPEGSFEQDFYISSLEKKPSETEMTIVQLVFESFLNSIESDNPKRTFDKLDLFIEEAIEAVNWQPNWKMETRVDKIRNSPVCQEYFENLKASQGKTVLSQIQHKEVTNTIESLKNNELTKKFFDREYLQNSKQLVCLYQVPIYFKYKNQDCKALPDIVMLTIDENKKIKEVMVIDLKTMWGNTLDFPDNVSKYRYDLQAAYYLEAIYKTDKSFFTELGYEIEDDTQILPFFFVVESISNPGKPLVYEVCENLVQQGKNGTQDIYYEDRLVKRGKRGFSSLIDELIYYQNNEFSEDILLKDRKGQLRLDINGIVA